MNISVAFRMSTLLMLSCVAVVRSNVVAVEMAVNVVTATVTSTAIVKISTVSAAN